jgi:hypothetical protein
VSSPIANIALLKEKEFGLPTLSKFEQIFKSDPVAKVEVSSKIENSPAAEKKYQQ